MNKILVGVTGGIAAYKTCELVRLLKKAGHEVRVVMTDCAKQFVGAITFAALSGNPVHDDTMSQANAPMRHIELAKWADRIIIAPASATTLSALASGDASKLLTALCLATQAPCYLAPAMNASMWHHPAVQENVKKLAALGYQILPPDSGVQACGDNGMGRMPEPESLFEALLARAKSLTNINVLITAGPTYEKLDPIRFLGNTSSGKMGYAMAKAFIAVGANVHLISGPTKLAPPLGATITSVINAQEMLDAVDTSINNTDIFVCAAAIANYAPRQSQVKLKSTEALLTLTLERTPDLLQTVAYKNDDVFYVGFCAESENIIERAQTKRRIKKCQAIVANLITASGEPFGHEENEVFYLTEDEHIAYPKMNKPALAEQLVSQITMDFTKVKRSDDGSLTSQLDN